MAAPGRGQRILRPRKTEILNLFMNSVMVGKLERKNTGALSFMYDQSWLEREKSIPISRQLPLQEKPFVGASVRDYFDNLLPDNKQVREKIAAAAHAAGTQAFDLLSALGRDCVGALQIYPEGRAPDGIKAAQGESISDAKIAEFIRSLRMNPLGISDETDFRISLAGTQSKTALLWKDERWFIPNGSTPTTHILKPAIGHVPGRPDLSHSVENEWLCLKILGAYGMSVTDSEILDFKGVRVLSVKRFDREWSGDKLLRVPQEDLCQALGVGSEFKYEADGGPGIGKILSFLNESDKRDEDRRSFMKAQLIFWLLSAIDGHAKNFSIFIRPNGFVMAPLYDVMSINPHIHPAFFPWRKVKLAMAVGNNRHYKMNEIVPRHWLQTAEKYKFTEIDALMKEVADATPGVIEKVTAALPQRFPTSISGPIFQAITKRAKTLLNRNMK